MKGKICLVINNKKTNEVKYICKHNVIVNAGRNVVASILSNQSSAYVKTIKVGSDTTSETVNDTDLYSMHSYKDIQYYDVNNNQVTYKTTFLQTEANNTWGELGLYLSNNVLLSRVTVTSWLKTSDYEVSVLWTVTY